MATEKTNRKQQLEQHGFSLMQEWQQRINSMSALPAQSGNPLADALPVSLHCIAAMADLVEGWLELAGDTAHIFQARLPWDGAAATLPAQENNTAQQEGGRGSALFHPADSGADIHPLSHPNLNRPQARPPHRQGIGKGTSSDDFHENKYPGEDETSGKAHKRHPKRRNPDFSGNFSAEREESSQLSKLGLTGEEELTQHPVESPQVDQDGLFTPQQISFKKLDEFVSFVVEPGLNPEALLSRQQESDSKEPTSQQQESDHNATSSKQQESDHNAPSSKQQESDHNAPSSKQQESDHNALSSMQQESDHRALSSRQNRELPPLKKPSISKSGLWEFPSLGEVKSRKHANADDRDGMNTEREMQNLSHLHSLPGSKHNSNPLFHKTNYADEKGIAWGWQEIGRRWAGLRGTQSGATQKQPAKPFQKKALENTKENSEQSSNYPWHKMAREEAKSEMSGHFDFSQNLNQPSEEGGFDTTRIGAFSRRVRVDTLSWPEAETETKIPQRVQDAFELDAVMDALTEQLQRDFKRNYGG